MGYFAQLLSWPLLEIWCKWLEPCSSALAAPHRYEILTPNAIPKGFMDGKQACEKMVSAGQAGSCARPLAHHRGPRRREGELGPPLRHLLTLSLFFSSPPH